MQFLVTAYDGKDKQAQERRAAARPDHIEGAKALQEAGHILIGGAILDEEGNMVGSSMVVEFENQEELEKWVNNDPYVTGNVWQEIYVSPFRVAVKS